MSAPRKKRSSRGQREKPSSSSADHQADGARRRLKTADDDAEPREAEIDAPIVSPLVRLFAPGGREGTDRLGLTSDPAYPRAFHAGDALEHTSDRDYVLAPTAEEPASQGPRSARATLELVLHDLFAFANSMRVDCLCLRGYASFPSLPSDAHVHVLVRPAERAMLVELLERACRRNGASIVDRSVSTFAHAFTIYSTSTDGEHAFLELDVHEHVACGTIPILSAEELFPGRYHTKSARIPLAVHEALIDLFERWFGSTSNAHELDPTWPEAAEREAERSRVHFEKVARDLLGRRLARELSDHARCGSLHELASRRARYRNAVLARARMRRPLAFARAWISRGLRALDPFLHPRGRLVAVLGRDERKRRAIAEWVAHELRFVVRGRATIVEFKPGAPNADGTRGAIGCVRAWVACLRLHLRRVRQHGRELAVVVCDHYPYEAFFAPAHERARGRSLLARALSKLVPAPDLVLLDTAAHGDGAEAVEPATYVLGSRGYERVDHPRGSAPGARAEAPTGETADARSRDARIDAKRRDAIVKALLCGEPDP